MVVSFEYFGRDIYAAAYNLIKQFGDEAAIQASMRADELLEAGDMDGVTVWKQIIKAIDELQVAEVPEGMEVH